MAFEYSKKGETVEDEARRKNYALPSNKDLNKRDNGAVRFIFDTLRAPQANIVSAFQRDGFVNPYSDEAAKYTPSKALGLKGAPAFLLDVGADPVAFAKAGKFRGILKEGAATRPKGYHGKIKLTRATREGIKSPTALKANTDLLGDAKKAADKKIVDLKAAADAERKRVVMPQTVRTERRTVRPDGTVGISNARFTLRNGSQARSKVRQAPGATSTKRVVGGKRFLLAESNAAKAARDAATLARQSEAAVKQVADKTNRAKGGGSEVAGKAHVAREQEAKPATNNTPAPESVQEAMFTPRGATTPGPVTPESVARKQVQDERAWSQVDQAGARVDQRIDDVIPPAQQAAAAAGALPPVQGQAVQSAGVLGENVVRSNAAAVREGVEAAIPPQALRTVQQAKVKRKTVALDRKVEEAQDARAQLDTPEGAKQHLDNQRALNQAVTADKYTEAYHIGFGLNPIGKSQWGIAIEKGLPTEMLRARAEAGKAFEKFIVKGLDSELAQSLSKLFRAKHGTRAGLLAYMNGLNNLSQAELQAKAADFTYNVARGASKADFEEASNLASVMQGSDYVLGQDTLHTVAARAAEKKMALHKMEQRYGIQTDGRLGRTRPGVDPVAIERELQDAREALAMAEKSVAVAHYLEGTGAKSSEIIGWIQREMGLSLRGDRSAGLIYTDLTNYIPMIEEMAGRRFAAAALGGDPFYTQGRKIAGADRTEARDGYEVMHAVFTRLQAGYTAQNRKIAMDELARQFGRTPGTIPADEAADFVRIPQDKLSAQMFSSFRDPRLGDETLLVHNEVAEQLFKVDELYQSEAALKFLGDGLANLTRMFRQLSYTIQPGHMFVDGFGNATLYAMERPDLMHHFAAATMDGSAMKLTLGASPKQMSKGRDLSERLTFGEHTLTVDEWVRATQTSGVLNGGYISAELGKLAPTNAWSRSWNGYQQVGQNVENATRSAAFIASMKGVPKGTPLDEAIALAADDVNRSMLNYATGLSKFERRWMRTVFPFYSWVRLSTPVLLRQAIEQPALWQMYPRLQEQSLDQAGLTFPREILPNYTSGSFLTKDDGEGISMWNPKLPQTSLDMARVGQGTESARGTAGGIAGMLNPAIKLLPEIAGGQTLSGMPIDQSVRGYADYASRSMGGPIGGATSNTGLLSGGGSNWDKVEDAGMASLLGFRRYRFETEKLGRAFDYQKREATGAAIRRGRARGILTRPEAKPSEVLAEHRGGGKGLFG